MEAFYSVPVTKLQGRRHVAQEPSPRPEARAKALDSKGLLQALGRLVECFRDP